METTTILDASAKLAKRELIERTHTAAFNAVMAHHLAFPFPCGDKLDGDDLAEMWGPVPVPVSQSAPAPRRQRKQSLAKICKAARKAGADRVIVDGVVVALSPAAAAPEPEPKPSLTSPTEGVG